MAAGITDRFTNASNGSRPTPTTLNALLASGASPGTANCAALTGWPTGTAVHFVIYTIDSNGKKVSGSQTDWKAIVSGATLTNMTLKAGTNSGYSVGAIVEASPTAAWADDMATGLQAEHKQTGAHSNITTDSIVNAGALTQTGNVALAGKLMGSDAATPIIPLANHTLSGGLWTLVSALNGTMTAWKGWVNNKFVTVAAIASRGYTASKDTYVDVKDDGTVVYVEVANGATVGMTLTTNSDGTPAYRMGKLVTSGAAITKIFQGVGIVPTGTASGIVELANLDPLGNQIYNKEPFVPMQELEVNSLQLNPLSTTVTDVPNSTLIVNLPVACFVVMTLSAYMQNNGTGSVSANALFFVDAVQKVAVTERNLNGGEIDNVETRSARVYLAAGSHTFKCQGSATINGLSAWNDGVYSLRFQRA